MSHESLLVQLARGQRGSRPLVLLPPGAKLPEGLVDRATVVQVTSQGYRLLASGKPRGDWLDPSAWTTAPGWRMRVPSEHEEELTFANQTDWTAPELRVIDGDGRIGARVKLPVSEGEEMIVGRHEEKCDLVLPDTAVSRRHFRVVRRSERIWVEDLGSSGGTSVNDEKLTGPRELRHEDRIRVGSSELECFSFVDAVAGEAQNGVANDAASAQESMPAPVVVDPEPEEEEEEPAEQEEGRHSPVRPLWELALPIALAAVAAGAAAWWLLLLVRTG